MTLGFQNHWRIANGGVGIVPRDLTLAEIRSDPLVGRMRGWHYNRGQYSRGALYLLKMDICNFFSSGLYLWEHILEGDLEERSDHGIWQYGEKTIANTIFRLIS